MNSISMKLFSESKKERSCYGRSKKAKILRILQFDSIAFKDYKRWEKTDAKIADRINELIQPEPLKGNWQGYWSRRITLEHRLVYKVTADSIIIASCKFHYT